MSIFNASTTADLLKYVALAKDGDQILLAPGTYSGVRIQNVVKTNNVTITSADTTHPAVLTDLTVRNSQGLTFTNLEMFAKTDVPFQVLSSQRIAFDRIDVHGTLNGSSNDDTRAMLVRGSSNVSVTNSYFHEVTDALSHLNSRNIDFSGNRFDLIRDNGISGGGSSFVTIANNVFTNFDHVGAMHPDAIQFWTTNTTAAATDITITGNTFNRGTGAIVQGIFIQDEVGKLPYQRVTVADNVIVGAMYHGIAVRGATDATLTNNTVIGQKDQMSWIHLKDVAKATLAGNVATTWSLVNSKIDGSGDSKASSLTLADAASVSAALEALAKPGQLSGVAAQFKAWVLSDVNDLGYTDGPPLAPQGKALQTAQVYAPLGGDSGAVTTAAAPAPHVQQAAAAPASPAPIKAEHHYNGDFDGDGRDDILLRNSSGTLTNWLGTASGGFHSNDAALLADVPTDWKIAGTGDFNGDGRDDILWRHSSGAVTDWLGAQGGGFLSNDAKVLADVPTDWKVVGTGDFNGDGRDDILWRHSSGTVTDWLGSQGGGFISNDAKLFANVPTDWEVAGTGDFNGDGRDDILWRHSSGTVTDWLGTQTGGFLSNDAKVLADVPTDWKVVGTGDFNGDGRDDVLWRHSSGTVTNWLGTQSGDFVSNDTNGSMEVSADWQVGGTGDYNGDGRDDILLRQSSGAVTDHLGTQTGGFMANDPGAAVPLAADWLIQAHSVVFG